MVEHGKKIFLKKKVRTQGGHTMTEGHGNTTVP
jgi:hypothetical protein